MSEEKAPKHGNINHQQPEIKKGYDAERSGFEKLNYPDRGNLSEGYQPIRDITSTPPDGGSGVPDKKDD
jgi:hypothetical protein